MKNSSLDSLNLETCSDQDDVKERLKADLKLSEQLSITSTPSVFINGRKVLQGLDRTSRLGRVISTLKKGTSQETAERR